jgi:hypothetical protein
VPGIGLEASPRYAEFLGRVFRSEVMPPGVIFELDRVDWRIHRREFRVGAIVVVAAVAAANGHVQLFNPPGQVVATVVAIAVRPTAANRTQVRVTTAEVVNLANAQYFDSRVNVAGAAGWVGAHNAGNLHVNTFTNAAPQGTQIWDEDVPINTRQLLRIPPLVIGPGAGINIVDGTVNEVFEVEVVWDERPMSDEEKAQA